MPVNELHSVVAPMYNEAAVLEEFYGRITKALAGLPSYEIIAVDDGSTDSTFEILARLADADPRLKVLRLSRNFGHEIATTAGMDVARGDTVTVIDADLQDPPELVPVLIEKWRQGADVVFTVRHHRNGETWFKKLSASIYYRLLRSLARVDIPADAGDFRLMSSRAATALGSMRERSRYVRGLAGWVGFERAYVEYDRDPRFAGETKYPLSRLIPLALQGIVSFSVRPLHLATLAGFAASGLGFAYGVFVLIYWYTTRLPVAGWTSLMIVLLFFGGVQLITLGIMGEYVGRTYEEVRGRPLYLVREERGL